MKKHSLKEDYKTGSKRYRLFAQFISSKRHLLKTDKSMSREDGYHVPVTTTEWLPNTTETPRYPDFGYFFNDNNSSVHEGYHGEGYDNYASPRHTENVLVKKHHVQYQPVAEENVSVQRRHAQYEPAAENAHVQRRHAQYEPVTEKVIAKKPHARYEPVNEGKRQTHHREDVNIEADDFIKRKHRALDLSKFMSMKTYNKRED